MTLPNPCDCDFQINFWLIAPEKLGIDIAFCHGMDETIAKFLLGGDMISQLRR